jgi:Zn-dependent protease/CBS domain-containing protein
MQLRGSLTIAVVAGIPIRVHWTFAILLVWFLATGWAQGGTVIAGLTSAAFVLAVFACVVLHELGHALTARRFGVRTRDITLLPIGGVASLERIPEKPSQELAIALAGPAVNVVIAAALLGGVGLQDAVEALQRVDRAGSFLAGFLASLAAVNVTLVLFNLIPAFPMDGGRVLRALLATRLGFARATQVAASIGQGFAVLMAVIGMFRPMPMLILVALFVWIAAGAEASQVESRSAIAGLPVAAAMMRRFTVLGVDDTLEAAASELLAGAQHDFPVTRDGSADEPVMGVLTRGDLVAALARGGLGSAVRAVMRPSCPLARPGEPLERAVEAMRAGGCPLVPVVDGGRLVGLVTPENVAELIAVRNAGLEIAGSR